MGLSPHGSTDLRTMEPLACRVVNERTVSPPHARRAGQFAHLAASHGRPAGNPLKRHARSKEVRRLRRGPGRPGPVIASGGAPFGPRREESRRRPATPLPGWMSWTGHSTEGDGRCTPPPAGASPPPRSPSPPPPPSRSPRLLVADTASADTTTTVVDARQVPGPPARAPTWRNPHARPVPLDGLRPASRQHGPRRDIYYRDQVYWGRLERTKGVYDFSSIEDRL